MWIFLEELPHRPERFPCLNVTVLNIQTFQSFFCRRVNTLSVAETRRTTEPRWPAVLVTLAMAAIHFALPEHLTLGPSWLVPALIFLFLIPAALSSGAGRFNLNATFGIAMLSVITMAEIWSLSLLIR